MGKNVLRIGDVDDVRGTPLWNIAASLFGHGLPHRSIARMIDWSPQLTIRVCKDPDFVELAKHYADTHDLHITEALLAGELKAAAKLISLLDSESDDVALKAAISLLDRKGMRGRPIDKLESKQVVLQGDAKQLLDAALADPGVRARLAELQPSPPTLTAIEAPRQDDEPDAVLLPEEGTSLRGEEDQWEDGPSPVYAVSKPTTPLPCVVPEAPMQENDQPV